MDDELVGDFVQEAKEHLATIEEDILAIERGGADINSDLVNKVFRAIHTIKGGAGFIGLTTVKDLSHHQEHLLNMIRNRQLVPTPQICGALLATIDVLSKLIDDWANSNSVDVSSQIAQLEALAKGEAAPAAPTAPPTASPIASSSTCSLDSKDVETILARGEYVFEIRFDCPKDFPDNATRVNFFSSFHLTSTIWKTEVPLDALKVDKKDFPDAFSMTISTVIEPDFIETLLPCSKDRVIHISKEKLKPTPTASAPPPPPSAAPTPPAAPQKPSSDGDDGEKKAAAGAAETTLRVNIRTLDQLMSLAGELVLTRNQLLQTIKSDNPKQIDTIAQRIDTVTSDLQLAIMSTRMQPIGRVFNKFRRVVRDLSQKLGKSVELTIEGEDVELDKTIVESIGDPLTHLVRNSVDHGIEMPDVRVKARKPPTGTLKLCARHEAGHVIIEIIDDGKGIDHNKVKAKALTIPAYDKTKIEAMGPKELVRLIFDPGFSLAEKVTEVSGRGVGMDVVMTNFTALGGVVDVDTTIGAGTTVRIKLPLTLAIIPSLAVRVQDDYFAIPQVNLVELVRITPDRVDDRIQNVGGALVMRHRGQLLPLLRLQDVLGIPASQTQDDTKKKKNRAMGVTIVSAGEIQYGIIVDEFLDSEEIVVKPLGDILKECGYYMGATIKGDGRVALIIDVLGLCEAENLSHVTEKMEKTQALAKTLQQQDDTSDIAKFLIVLNGPEEYFAVPLELVSRIELVKSVDISKIGGRANIEYRGGSLALISIEEVVPVTPRAEGEFVYVLVHKWAGKEIGVVVADIVDVLDIAVDIDYQTFRQPGVIGSSIIQDNTTLFLDVIYVISKIFPDWEQKPGGATAAIKDVLVLVVDDSEFYRRQLTRIVESCGHKVLLAEDGQIALNVLKERISDIHIVLADIEMPNLNGFELCQAIRQTQNLAHLPCIAVTSLAGDEERAKGMSVGFNEYMIKLDRELLKATLQKFVSQLTGTGKGK